MRRLWMGAVIATAVLVVATALPAAAAVRGPGPRTLPHMSFRPMPLARVAAIASAARHEAALPLALRGTRAVTTDGTRADARTTTANSTTVGENPIGRVTNSLGFAGYSFGSTDNEDLQTFFTIPNPTPTNPPDSGWPGTQGSGASIVLQNGRFTVQLQVATVLNSEINSEPVFSTLDDCSPLCPGYNPGFHAGDSMEMYLDTSTTGSSAGVIDLTNGNSKTWTAGALGGAPPVGLVGEEDYCGYLLVEPCANIIGSAQVSGPPPNYLDYDAISFGDTTVNGELLGQAFNDAGFAWWSQCDELWGNVYDAETQNLGTGGSFLVTATDETLPAVSVTAGPPSAVDRPLTGASIQIPFDVNLSFGSTDTIYVDYTTSDGGSAAQGQPATAGQDYTAESGTLTFQPGTTDQIIDVPVLAGANQGGDRLFSFSVANPSFAVSGNDSATATIHEGPVVYGVVNSPVPLNGGQAAETITGADFGQPGTHDTVGICALQGSGSSACVPATNVVVQSDTTITFTAPDGTSLSPSTGGVFPVDTQVTNPQGIPSPITTVDEIDYGCNTGNTPIGNYTVTGCLTPETYDDSDVTEGDSSIDGAVQVLGSAADAISYGTSPGAGSVSSKGSTSVGLNIAGQLFTIFQGRLQQSLSGPMTFTLPAGFSLFGMKASGQLTLTPDDSGSASGSVTVTLPGILGAETSSGGSTAGATGTLSFTAAAGSAGGTGGISSLTVTVPQAQFLNMFQVSNATLSFQAPGTWNVSATVTGGDGQTSTLAGSLVYAGNTLTSASLTLGQVSLAGLANLTNFQLSYSSSTGWSGSGTLSDGSGDSSESATVAVAVNSSLVVSSASIDASNVTLFGALNLKTFSLKYSSGKWALALSTTLGGTATNASLTVQNGVIQSGSVTIGKVQFGAGMTINSASLSYSASATSTPSGCTAGPGNGAITGSDIWCGTISVTLPGAKQTVSGFADFVSSSFEAGGFNVQGLQVPLLEGVFLNSIGAQVALPSGSAGLTVQGSAGVSFGPVVAGSSLLSATGSVTVTYPGSGGTGGGYVLSIDQLTGPGGLVLGSGSLSLPDSGAAQVTAQLGAAGSSGISLAGGTVVIAGNLSGQFTATSFNITGSGTATVGSASLSVEYKMDSKGIAGCTLVNGLITKVSAGFQYTWGGSVTTYATPTSAAHCTFTGY